MLGKLGIFIKNIRVSTSSLIMPITCASRRLQAWSIMADVIRSVKEHTIRRKAADSVTMRNMILWESRNSYRS